MTEKPRHTRPLALCRTYGPTLARLLQAFVASVIKRPMESRLAAISIMAKTEFLQYSKVVKGQ
jgi:hypothetical protein